MSKYGSIQCPWTLSTDWGGMQISENAIWLKSAFFALFRQLIVLPVGDVSVGYMFHLSQIQDDQQQRLE